MSLLRLSIQQLLESETQEAREHPALEQLLALRAAEVHPELEDSIREHLVLCSECRLAFLDFDWWASSASVTQATWSSESGEAWRKLRGRLPHFERRGRSASARPPIRGPNRGVWLALAASLLLTIGTGSWAVHQQAELAAFRQPTVNPAIVELIPEESRIRRGRTRDLVPETLESGSQSILLIVYPPVALMDQEQLSLTLTSAQGQPIFQSSGVKADRLRPVSLVVPRSLLPPGAYSLRLSASGTSTTQVYQFLVDSQR